MPIIFIEAPEGVRAEAKQAMVKKINAAVEEAYPTGHTMIFLREYPRENVAIDGVLRSTGKNSRLHAAKSEN
jgi:phenylpyruvate tautomerase PptA (4-oxalocrotonate tautomerase family)